MSTVTPKELLAAWKLEQMPLEMTMGHVVQNLVILRDEIDRLIAHLRLPPTFKGKLKSFKPDEPLILNNQAKSTPNAYAVSPRRRRL